jgi:predicted RNA-binding protein with PUA-like domain
MHHWLMKSEPDAFGIDTLQRQGVAPWDGVRNYESRNSMRRMAVGDRVIFYHSNAKPSGVAGLAEVARAAFPDHTAWDPSSKYFDPASPPDKPRWYMVEVRYIATFPRVVALDELRQIPELADMQLFTRSRLSVIPVEPHHYELVVALAQRAPATGRSRAPAPAAKAKVPGRQAKAKPTRPASESKKAR